MKKIMTIVALSLIGLLAVTTIVLACIQYNYNRLQLSQVEYITIYNNGDTKTLFSDVEEEKEEVNQLISLYKKAQKQNLLNALFQGNVNKEVEVTRSTTTNLNTTVKNAVAIQFYFEKEQKIMVGGKAYTYNNNEVTYRYATIVLSNNHNVEEYTLYFSNNVSSTTTVYSITGLAHFADLYQYVVEYDNYSTSI